MRQGNCVPERVTVAVCEVYDATGITGQKLLRISSVLFKTTRIIPALVMALSEVLITTIANTPNQRFEDLIKQACIQIPMVADAMEELLVVTPSGGEELSGRAGKANHL